MISRKLTGTEQQFAIGKIVCLARNYAEHAKELDNETPAAPVLFTRVRGVKSQLLTKQK